MTYATGYFCNLQYFGSILYAGFVSTDASTHSERIIVKVISPYGAGNASVVCSTTDATHGTITYYVRPFIIGTTVYAAVLEYLSPNYMLNFYKNVTGTLTWEVTGTGTTVNPLTSGGTDGVSFGSVYNSYFYYVENNSNTFTIRKYDGATTMSVDSTPTLPYLANHWGFIFSMSCGPLLWVTANYKFLYGGCGLSGGYPILFNSAVTYYYTTQSGWVAFDTLVPSASVGCGTPTFLVTGGNLTLPYYTVENRLYYFTSIGTQLYIAASAAALNNSVYGWGYYPYLARGVKVTTGGGSISWSANPWYLSYSTPSVYQARIIEQKMNASIIQWTGLTKPFPNGVYEYYDDNGNVMGTFRSILASFQGGAWTETMNSVALEDLNQLITADYSAGASTGTQIATALLSSTYCIWISAGTITVSASAFKVKFAQTPLWRCLEILCEMFNCFFVILGNLTVNMIPCTANSGTSLTGSNPIAITNNTPFSAKRALISITGGNNLTATTLGSPNYGPYRESVPEIIDQTQLNAYATAVATFLNASPNVYTMIYASSNWLNLYTYITLTLNVIPYFVNGIACYPMGRIVDLLTNTAIYTLYDVLTLAKFQLNGTTDASINALATQANTNALAVSFNFSAIAVDHGYIGFTYPYTAGETLALGDFVYLKAADTRVWKAKADAIATAKCLGVCVVGGVAGATVTILIYGIIRDDSFAAMTIGDVVYLSTATAGIEQSNTVPSANANCVSILGHALAVQILFVNPDPMIIEIIA